MPHIGKTCFQISCLSVFRRSGGTGRELCANCDKLSPMIVFQRRQLRRIIPAPIRQVINLLQRIRGFAHRRHHNHQQPLRPKVPHDAAEVENSRRILHRCPAEFVHLKSRYFLHSPKSRAAACKCSFRAVGYDFRAVRYDFRTVGCDFWVVGYDFWVVGCHFRAVGYGFRVLQCHFRTR